MVFEVRRSLACRRDLDQLFDHLLQSYLDLGERSDSAFERAVARIEEIESRIDALGAAPHQGTLWPEVLPGLRWTTKDRAIFYFIVDDIEDIVRVLAVFYSGQDHHAQMRGRITSGH